MNPPRVQWTLDGPWWLKDEPDLEAIPSTYTTLDLETSGWREVPPATHLQPWLYPENPYWGKDVRAINDRAWWYRTHFRFPAKDARECVRLVFEAVDYYAEVWCNETYLGAHEGNFAPFSFDVTDILQAENVLVVKVTAPWDSVRRKGLTYVDEVHRGMVKGLYAHGDGLIPRDANPIGIWRPVRIETHGEVTIERITHRVVEDEFDRSAHVTLCLHVHNHRSEPVSGVLHVRLEGETFRGVRGNEHEAFAVPPGEHIIEHEIRIPDPHWWWPWDLGRPDLYWAQCTLYERKNQLDRQDAVFGIRHVKLLRTRNALHYQINKVPFFVRGTTYMGGLYLSQLTPEQIESDLQRVRDCGLNLIRLHVHVAPREVYETCDRMGIMVWQDFELNWLHDPSPEFEERAVSVMHEMVTMLENHACIITWCTHNEPTALPFLDANLYEHPDPRLFQELSERDPTRPCYICSGKNEGDWQHSGDSHAYIGGGHGGHYMDVFDRQSLLVTEFGCEAPPTVETLDETPLLAERLDHVRDRIDDIHAYQAALCRYQIEWYRRTRFEPCGGYIHFMFVDLYPQVGCGVMDVNRRPRPALEALKSASQPIHIMMEYTPQGPKALWVVNDLPRPLLGCLAEWEVRDDQDNVVTRGSAKQDIPPQRADRVALFSWQVKPDRRYTVRLRLSRRGEVIDENVYNHPFQDRPRPSNYPWDFDPVLGMRCYGGRHAQSSLRILNTWYGKLARWLLPIYDWAESMLGGQQLPSRFGRLLKRIYG